MFRGKFSLFECEMSKLFRNLHVIHFCRSLLLPSFSPFRLIHFSHFSLLISTLYPFLVFFATLSPPSPFTTFPLHHLTPSPLHPLASIPSIRYSPRPFPLASYISIHMLPPSSLPLPLMPRPSALTGPLASYVFIHTLLPPPPLALTPFPHWR